MGLQHTIKPIIRPGEQSGFVAECVEIPVVTQGKTLDAVSENLKEAVELHLEGENLASLGLVSNPTIIVTYELEPQLAKPQETFRSRSHRHYGAIRVCRPLSKGKSRLVASHQPGWADADTHGS